MFDDLDNHSVVTNAVAPVACPIPGQCLPPAGVGRSDPSPAPNSAESASALVDQVALGLG